MADAPVPDVDAAQVFERAAQVFGLLATPQRLRILDLLCRGGKTLRELCDALGATRASISQNLAALQRSGVLLRRREKAGVLYCVNPSQSPLLCDAVRKMVGLADGH